MKIKFFKKIIIILIMFTFFICFFKIYALASSSTGQGAVNEFMDELTNLNYNSDSAPNSAAKLIGSIIWILQIIFVATAIIMLMVIGIKFMVGSIEQKAEIKKHLVYYVMGTILLFSAVGIVEIIQKLVIGDVVPIQTTGGQP